MIPPDFLIIPHQIVIDESLKPLDKFLYGVIYWMVKLKNEHCYASNHTLSELINAHPKTVGKGLQRLERAGYIARRYSEASLAKGRLYRDEIVPLISFTKGTPPNGGGGIPPNGGQNKSSPKKNIYTDKFKEMKRQLIRSKSI